MVVRHMGIKFLACFPSVWTKFVNSDTSNHKPPSAPVQLNPVEVPTNKLEFMAGKTKVLPPIKENLPVPLSASRTAD